MDKRAELLKLLSDDPLGLLSRDAERKHISPQDRILISSFEEIQEFVEETRTEPRSNMSDINEFRLFSRLEAIRSDPKKVQILMKYDFAGLLNIDRVKEITINDIIADDPFNLIGDLEANEIFDLKFVKPVERIQPDYLSRRKVCKDFELYKDIFSQLHKELSEKERKLVRYNSTALQAGNFFILNGILLFLSKIEGNTDKFVFNSGERTRFDGRTLCIFDNGTESDMLYRSLDKAMQLDGYSISDNLSTSSNSTGIDAEDLENGFIYILTSRNPEIFCIPHLYKIGHTTGSVIQRIKNAKNESTYLFNEVDVVSTYRCYNISSLNLEKTIHDFFYTVRLDLDLYDPNRNLFRPREWFRVPLEIIEEAIQLILSENLFQYEYDPQIRQIIRKAV